MLYTRNKVKYPPSLLFVNIMLIYGVLKLTNRITCFVLDQKVLTLHNNFLRGCHTQQLITPEHFVKKEGVCSFEIVR